MRQGVVNYSSAPTFISYSDGGILKHFVRAYMLETWLSHLCYVGERDLSNLLSIKRTTEAKICDGRVF